MRLQNQKTNYFNFDTTLFHITVKIGDIKYIWIIFFQKSSVSIEMKENDGVVTYIDGCRN